MYDISVLFIPAFVAGLATFFAPCTFPLIPAYLGLISRATAEELADSKLRIRLRSKLMMNGLLFVLGFSAVFIALGAGFGLLGSVVVGFRLATLKIAGVFVFFAGLSMLGILRIPSFTLLKLKANTARRMPYGARVFVLGAALSTGWTPCIGPILGAVLALASASASVSASVQLLTIFSLGLAVPFLTAAFLFGTARQQFVKLNKYAPAINFVAGLSLMFFGVLIFNNQFAVLMGWGYKAIRFFDYQTFLFNFL